MSSNGTHGTHGNGGLPGANAMGDTLEFVKNLWSSMKIPGMSMPSMSPEEIDRQISDLKAVESWLQMNMNMLRGSIQALEVQSATLAALRSMGQSFAQAAAPATAAPAADERPPFESPFASKDAPQEDNAASAASAIPEAAALAAQFANPAVWWNAVQEQFSNAVGQSMQPPKKTARKTAARSASGARKTASSKTASGRTASGKTTTARKRSSRS